MSASITDRQSLREFEEHAFRFLQAQRDYPSINHKGTEPEIIQDSQNLFHIVEREFNRRA